MESSLHCSQFVHICLCVHMRMRVYKGKPCHKPACASGRGLGSKICDPALSTRVPWNGVICHATTEGHSWASNARSMEYETLDILNEREVPLPLSSVLEPPAGPRVEHLRKFKKQEDPRLYHRVSSVDCRPQSLWVLLVLEQHNRSG